MRRATTAAGLAERGYRRTSRRHGLVARVDRADWLEHMATQMGCAVADFYVRSQPPPAQVSGSWCDHYRRVYSLDVVELQPPGLALEVPPSDHDPTGYVGEVSA